MVSKMKQHGLRSHPGFKGPRLIGDIRRVQWLSFGFLSRVVSLPRVLGFGINVFLALNA